MAAEISPGRGSNPDCSVPTEKPGLRVLAIYRGSDVYVASTRPRYFRRSTPQPLAERSSVVLHPNQTGKPSGE